MVVAARATAALLSALHARRGAGARALDARMAARMARAAADDGADLWRRQPCRRRRARAEVNAPRMRDNLRRMAARRLAESLSLALAAAMPLEDAQALVKRRVLETRGSSDSLVAAVRRAAATRPRACDRLGSPERSFDAISARPAKSIDRILDEAKRSVR